MLQNKPELPAAYRLLHLPHATCLRDEVIRLAEQGAEEGTIVWAEEVGRVRDLKGHVWNSHSDNLHAALVLEPETPPERDYEQLYIALVSLGNAIASMVAPMTALQFGWPNEIRIATHRIGEVWLDRGQNPDSGQRWITVAFTVFVGSTPATDPDSSMSLHEAEGNSDIERVALFEHWAREFVTWINLWDERGFSHVLKAWQARADVRGCEVNLEDADAKLTGAADGVDEYGRLVVTGVDGTTMHLSPSVFLGWDKL